MIRAVVFDLDGLLVDSEPVWFRARQALFQRFDMEWTEAEQQQMMGVCSATWLEYKTKKLAGRLTQEEIKTEILTTMSSDYLAGEVTLMPGAQEALNYCAMKYKLGLASGSPRQLIDAALDGANWRDYFSQVVSSDEVARGKPAPDSYLEACERLEVEPEETVVLEDSGAGILAGKAAGAKVIVVPNPNLMPNPEALHKADIRIASLTSLATALEKLS